MFLLKTTSLFLLACLYQNSLADAVLPMWAMCGGSAFVGTDTCSAELTCVYVNKFYSSCQQISQTQGITLQPVWAQCGGANWAGSTVCEPHLTCVYMSKWYSQCQQLATPPPETAVPTHAPTSAPVVVTSSPTKAPVVATSSPTKVPVVATSSPTKVPVVATSSPTKVPVVATSSPTQSPVVIATSAPTPEYTGPTVRPWGQCGGLKYTGNTHCEPGWVCTYDNPWYSQCLPPRPTTAPTPFPAGVTTPPTSAPSNSPSRLPTSAPTRIPTNAPSVAATFAPSRHPSPAPSVNPTGAPTPQPTLAVAPSTTSTTPTLSPSPPPTTQPTQAPTRAPTTEPSGSPTRVPTAAPTDSPSGSPSLSPTLIPSPQPTRRPTVVPTADTYTGPTVGEWGQCAGLTYTGSTVCAEGLTCVFTNAWYSQCQRVRATLSPSISPTVVPVPTKAPVVPVPTQAPIPVPTFPPTISPTAAPSVVPTTKPSVSPTPVPPPTDSPTWATLIGYSYGDNTFGTIASYTEDTLLACQDKCAAGPGCDFYTYQSSNRRCNVKFTDKAAYMSMEFKGQQSGYLFGYLRGGGIANVGTQTVASAAACRALCDANSNCQYVSYDTTTPGAVKCYQMRLKSAGGITLGFREQVRPPNYSPSTLGRFDVIGNAGIVAIAANLMPDGRILLGARPEYDRGGPNYDNISPNPTRAQQVPYGEIAAIFDPITATSVPSQIDDNIFCHGVVLAEDGRIFTAGGDGGGDMNRAAAVGLTNGLRKIRYFDPDTDEWTILDVKLQATRWYPTLIRVPSGSIWVMGGLVDGATNFNTQNSLELYTPGLPNTKLLHSPLLQMTGGGSYNYMTLIPQTGNIFAFAARHFAIIDKDTGQEVEDYNNGAGLVNGIRSGNYPSAGCTMPLKEDATGFVKAEWIMFGGVNNEWEEITVTEVARMVLTDPYGQKRWTYDSDPIPYGRIMSDCVLYPNGNILLFNGGRRGRTGGSIGEPLVQAAANDVFSYDPEAPAGQKFSVLAATPFQRFYHSNTVLVPDGRVLVMGTDEGTYVKDKTAYNHDVEAFTPPWLLDNTPRPVITAAPNTVIQFGSTFTVTCSGNVDKLTIMTPQSSTHGTEMTQRLYIPTIVGRQGNMITLRAPRDATVMMSGYHMLFAVNGKTPSVAQWIRLG